MTKCVRCEEVITMEEAERNAGFCDRCEARLKLIEDALLENMSNEEVKDGS